MSERLDGGVTQMGGQGGGAAPAGGRGGGPRVLRWLTTHGEGRKGTGAA